MDAILGLIALLPQVKPRESEKNDGISIDSVLEAAPISI